MTPEFKNMESFTEAFKNGESFSPNFHLFLQDYFNGGMLFEEYIEAFHDNTWTDDALEFTGLTLQEYGFLLTPDFHMNREKYIDFIDYLVRNCEEL